MARIISSSSESVMEETFVSTSLEEAHATIQKGCLCFSFGLFVGDSSPLFVFDNVGMNPRYLSTMSRNKDKTLLLLVVGINIVHP